MTHGSISLFVVVVFKFYLNICFYEVCDYYFWSLAYFLRISSICRDTFLP